MKVALCAGALTALLLAGPIAAEAAPSAATHPTATAVKDKNPGRNEKGFRRDNPAAEKPPLADSPERRAMRKRRFEIMVLLQAYRLLPENERTAVKTELTHRIEADLTASIANQRKRVAEIENELKLLQKDIEVREQNQAQLVENELARLLALPPEGPRNRRPASEKRPEPNPDRQPNHPASPVVVP